MRPWINLTIMDLIFQILNILRALISLDIVDIICSILRWVLGAYFFLVVWSYKKEITDGASGEEVQKA